MYWFVPVPLLCRCTAAAQPSASVATWQATRARAQLGTLWLKRLCGNGLRLSG